LKFVLNPLESIGFIFPDLQLFDESQLKLEKFTGSDCIFVHEILYEAILRCYRGTVKKAHSNSNFIKMINV